MKNVAIIAFVVLFGAVACLKLATKPPVSGGKPPGTNCWLPPHVRKAMEEEKKREEAAKKKAEESSLGYFGLPTNSWNSQGVHFNTSWNKTNTTNNTWNSQGWRFTEESGIFDGVTNFAKSIWAKRPWKKAPKNTTEESDYSSWNSQGVHFNTSWNKTNNTWNSAGWRFAEESGNSWNSQGVHFNTSWNRTNNTWNSAGWRFAEESSIVDRVKNWVYSKSIYGKRPWANTPKNAAEESGPTWNSQGVHFNTSWNKTNNTWNSAGWRFEEETAKPGFFSKVKGFAKGLWAKRPWKKAPKNIAEESGPTWNSQGVHFNATWNTSNYTNSWNSQGWRFEEETAKPSFFDKVKGFAKGIWAKRPWKKAPKSE